MCGVPAGRFLQRGPFNAMPTWMMWATQRCLRCCDTYMGFHQCKALFRICYSCRQYGHISSSELCPNRKNATVPVRPADNQQPSSSPGPVEGPKEEPVEPVCAALDMPYSGLTDEDFTNHVPDSRQFTAEKQQLSLQQQVIRHKKIIKELNSEKEQLKQKIETFKQESHHLSNFILKMDEFYSTSLADSKIKLNEYGAAMKHICEKLGKKLRCFQNHRCDQCGLFIRHHPRDCPATGYRCNNCNITDHFTLICPWTSVFQKVTLDEKTVSCLQKLISSTNSQPLSYFLTTCNSRKLEDNQVLTFKIV